MGNVNRVKHGLHALDARLRGRNLGAIDKRTSEGREALAYAEDALKRKGDATCPPYLKAEIKLATFDFFRLLHLQTFLVSDINQRGTPVRSSSPSTATDSRTVHSD